jgi:hypothetical protein
MRGGRRRQRGQCVGGWLVVLALGVGCVRATGSGSDLNAYGSPPTGGAVQSETMEVLGGRCSAFREVARGVTVVLSEPDGYRVVLPGLKWAVRCDDEQLLLGEMKGARGEIMLASVGVSDQSEGPPDSVLRAIHARGSVALREEGLELGSAQLLTLRYSAGAPRRLVMVYEANAPMLREMKMKNVHAWSVLRNESGELLEFHFSAMMAKWGDDWPLQIARYAASFVPISAA